MKKLSFTCLAILLSFSMYLVPASAFNDYNVRFGGVPPTILNWGNPHPSWSSISSKWQQPRNEGTNPHRGVDDVAAYGIVTNAVWNGWVVHSDAYTIRFLIDANNNGIKDDGNFYCNYQHLSSRKPAGYYVKGAEIGKTGDEGGELEHPHLHFGATDSTGTLWYRNEVNYRWTTAWNGGKDVDVYSNVQWDGANVVSFYAYFKTTGAGPFAPSEVRIYHRKSGTSTWIDGGTVTGNSNHKYTYNFTGKYPQGTNFHWMFRMTRSGLNSGVYNYAWCPAKFAQPDPNPNATTNPYGYYANTIQ